MRQVSRKRAAMQRIRGRLVRRTEPQACEWCHAEPSIDIHELVRRSQRRDAMIDLDVMVPIGRACHDWATSHPVEASQRGMAWFYWQDRDSRITSEPYDVMADPDESSYATSMPRQPTGRVAITVKYDPDDVEWIDATAKRRGEDRSETLRQLVKATRRQLPVPPPITDPAPTGGSTTPRSDHPPSARPYPKPSAGGKG